MATQTARDLAGGSWYLIAPLHKAGIAGRRFLGEGFPAILLDRLYRVPNTTPASKGNVGSFSPRGRFISWPTREKAIGLGDGGLNIRQRQPPPFGWTKKIPYINIWDKVPIPTGDRRIFKKTSRKYFRGPLSMDGVPYIFLTFTYTFTP